MQKDSCPDGFVSGHDLQLGKKLVVAKVSYQGTSLVVPSSRLLLTCRADFSPRGPSKRDFFSRLFNRRHNFCEGVNPRAAKSTQARSRGLLTLVLSLGFISVATAQTGTKPPTKATAWKEYCHPDYGFCFKYPSTWLSLGPIFDGNGIVVAPPQKQNRALWDEVTVALMIPPPEGDEDPVTIDQAIDKAVSSVRESGQNFDTVQRQERTVDGNPAQVVKLHYVDKSIGHEWIEELVFVEGPDSEIYSAGLKCAPESLTHMEPLFTRIVDSWKLPEPDAAAGTTDEAAPAGKSSRSPKTTPPKPNP